MQGNSSPARCLPARGFTLVEVLVIVVIVGITLSLVVVNFGRDDKRVLADEAQRLGLLLEHAHDEAVASSRLLSWAADAKGYQFAVATGPDTWMLLSAISLPTPVLASATIRGLSVALGRCTPRDWVPP